MNFEMSDDRRMLADTLRRALSDGYGFEHRTALPMSRRSTTRRNGRR
jgi:hypothetical protein